MDLYVNSCKQIFYFMEDVNPITVDIAENCVTVVGSAGDLHLGTVLNFFE